MKSFDSTFSRSVVVLQAAPFSSKGQKGSFAADELPSSGCSNVLNEFKDRSELRRVLGVETLPPRTLDWQSRLTPLEVKRKPHILFFPSK